MQKDEIWKGHHNGCKITCSSTVRISCSTLNKTMQKDEIWKGHHNGCKITCSGTVRISCSTLSKTIQKDEIWKDITTDVRLRAPEQLESHVPL